MTMNQRSTMKTLLKIMATGSRSSTSRTTRESSAAPEVELIDKHYNNFTVVAQAHLNSDSWDHKQ